MRISRTLSGLIAKNSNAFSSYVRKLIDTPNEYLLYGPEETLFLTAYPSPLKLYAISSLTSSTL